MLRRVKNTLNIICILNPKLRREVFTALQNTPLRFEGYVKVTVSVSTQYLYMIVNKNERFETRLVCLVRRSVTWYGTALIIYMYPWG